MTTTLLHGDALEILRTLGNETFGTILVDPPWRFQNRTGKMAPEHRRLRRYDTMSFQTIYELPVAHLVLPQSHLYLWVPNALIREGLEAMARWGFVYKTNLVWFKVRKDGGPDGRGVGFYFRNVTELVLFGVRGKLRTLAPGRRQVNLIATRKREHSRKPDEMYGVIEKCSPGPYLELFARHPRQGWTQWGDEMDDDSSHVSQERGIIGALRAGWRNVTGIDIDAEYLEIARLRVAHEEKQGVQTELEIANA